MRVLIDTTYAKRAPFSGTAIYLERLLEALSQIEGVELIPVDNPRRRLPAGGGIGSVRNLLTDRLWEGLELPQLLRRHRADAVHHPLPARSTGVRQVITVHDLAFERLPDCFDRGFRLFAHHSHRAAARSADAVICVSQTTAADVRELWAIAPERIVLARHGPGQLVERPTAGPPAHFLYVGDAEPRKDLPTLLAAYRLYRQQTASPVPLVLAGSVSEGVGRAAGDGRETGDARAAGDGRETAVAATGADGLQLIRHPPSAQLAELYAGALALVHPSLYEGFGLTPLEAMSSGVPVLAARSPGVEEVCAGAALYAEPRRPESFAAQMVRLAEEPRLCEDLSKRGRARAASFSWRASAESHVEAYRMAARQTSPLPSEST